MLLVECDLPAAAAAAELDAADAACEPRGDSLVRAEDADRGRLAAPGAAAGAPGAGAAGDRPDGGRRRAPRSGARSCSSRSRRTADRHGVRVATFGHAGDGNLHPNFIFDRDDPRAAELTDAVRDEIFAAALAWAAR